MLVQEMGASAAPRQSAEEQQLCCLGEALDFPRWTHRVACSESHLPRSLLWACLRAGVTHFWPQNTSPGDQSRVRAVGMCTQQTAPPRRPRQRRGHCRAAWLLYGAVLRREEDIPRGRAGQGCRAPAAMGLTACFAARKMPACLTVPARHGQGMAKPPANRLARFLIWRSRFNCGRLIWIIPCQPTLHPYIPWYRAGRCGAGTSAGAASPRTAHTVPLCMREVQK